MDTNPFQLQSGTSISSHYNRYIWGADIGNASLTGNFVVGPKYDKTNYTFSNDAITEGQETAVLSLNNGGASSSLIINDTSVYPRYKKYRHFQLL